MCPSTKGLAKVKKALASGKTIYYCYAWRGGPLLKNAKGKPIQPDDPEIQSAFDDAVRASKHGQTNDLSMLISRFRSSTDFKSKSPSSRREYDRYLDMIRDRVGTTTLDDLHRPSTRGQFKEWRDTMADRPRTADYAWTTLARVLSFAKDRGLIAVNIAERGGRLYAAERADHIWTEKEIAAFEFVAPPHLCLAMQVALWTGQRKGDLLRMLWSDFDGEVIRLKQSKTRARVAVPVAKPLRELFATFDDKTGTILRNSRGQPWTLDGFSSAWHKCAKTARIGELTFHDLRGTAVTRMAIAGCTVPEIAAVTGHTLRDVYQILEAHYLGGREALAANAIRKVEAAGAPQAPK